MYATIGIELVSKRQDSIIFLASYAQNIISIFGMKPEARDEVTNSFIAHFGLNAVNNSDTNQIVTIVKLALSASQWSQNGCFNSISICDMRPKVM